jgi:hypothetical protein
MRAGKHLEYLSVLALLVTFFGYFTVRIWDIDFWWHIAAGKDILLTGNIPSIDPFGVYQADNVCGQTVLKSEWLGQVVLYLAYRLMELDGVILLRAGVLTFCLAIVYLRCRLSGVSGLFALVIAALSGIAILNFTGERPNLFSFLFIGLTFLLLDEYTRTGKRWLLYGIPLVILVWSNAHGGVVLGVAILGLYGMVFIFEQYRTEGDWKTRPNMLMAMTVFLSVVVLLISPSGLDTLKCILFQQSGTFVKERVSEYQSPITLWRAAMYYWVFVGVAMTSLLGLFALKQYRQAAVLLCLGALSVIGYRYIPFFVLAGAPYVAAGLERLMRNVRVPSALISLVMLILSLGFLGYGIKQNSVFQFGVAQHRFPIGAVEYIKNNSLHGKVFNSINWGGYLLWHLKDKMQVFIDGRTLDMNRMIPYTHILWMTPEGRQFFAQGDFDLVLVSKGNQFSGERYPLVAYLKNQSNWKVAYQDAKGYLFERR